MSRVGMFLAATGVVLLAGCSSLSGFMGKSGDSVITREVSVLSGAVFGPDKGAIPFVLEITEGPQKGCQIVAMGKGDFKTERVHAITKSLYCKSGSAAQPTPQPLEGFLVGADGKTSLSASTKQLKLGSTVLEIEAGTKATVVLHKLYDSRPEAAE